MKSILIKQEPVSSMEMQQQTLMPNGRVKNAHGSNGNLARDRSRDDYMQLAASRAKDIVVNINDNAYPNGYNLGTISSYENSSSQSLIDTMNLLKYQNKGNNNNEVIIHPPSHGSNYAYASDLRFGGNPAGNYVHLSKLGHKKLVYDEDETSSAEVSSDKSDLAVGKSVESRGRSHAKSMERKRHADESKKSSSKHTSADSKSGKSGHAGRRPSKSPSTASLKLKKSKNKTICCVNPNLFGSKSEFSCYLIHQYFIYVILFAIIAGTSFGFYYFLITINLRLELLEKRLNNQIHQNLPIRLISNKDFLKATANEEWMENDEYAHKKDAAMLNNRESVYKKTGAIKNLRKMQFINLKDVDKKQGETPIFQTSESLGGRNEETYDEYDDDFRSQNVYSNEQKIQFNMLTEFETSYFILKRMNQTDFLIFPADFKEDLKDVFSVNECSDLKSYCLNVFGQTTSHQKQRHDSDQDEQIPTTPSPTSTWTKVTTSSQTPTTLESTSLPVEDQSLIFKSKEFDANPEAYAAPEDSEDSAGVVWDENGSSYLKNSSLESRNEFGSGIEVTTMITSTYLTTEPTTTSTRTTSTTTVDSAASENGSRYSDEDETVETTTRKRPASAKNGLRKQKGNNKNSKNRHRKRLETEQNKTTLPVEFTPLTKAGPTQTTPLETTSFVKTLSFFRAEEDYKEKNKCNFKYINPNPQNQVFMGVFHCSWMNNIGSNHSDNAYYYTKSYKGSSLTMCSSLDELKSNRCYRHMPLQYSYYGTGHAIYKDYLFYHQDGSRELISHSIESRDKMDVRRIDAPEEAACCDSNLYSIKHSGFFDFETDEYGLWIIYKKDAARVAAESIGGFDGSYEIPSGSMDARESADDVYVVAKVDESDYKSLKIEQKWSVRVNKQNVANMFIACGQLYALKNTVDNPALVYKLCDLVNDASCSGSYENDQFNITISSRQLTSMRYNPDSKLIYMVDGGSFVYYTTRIDE